MIEILTFSEKIIIWHQKYGRKTLPWQKNTTTYKIWVSEIMLQQTQVIRVIPYFKKFINRFPNIKTLAQSKIDVILYLWSGLGYYARAHNLHNTAKIIVDKYQAIFPTDFNILTNLPGIGKSTAGAILSLSLEQKHPILDANVKRILTRYYTINGHLNSNIMEKTLWSIINNIMPDTNISNFNQGLMDLGELVCTNKRPKCTLCPLKKGCQANLNHTYHLYPNKKPKTNIIKKKKWLLILKYQHTVWVQKCTAKKIWNGLFCFPEFSTEEALRNWLSFHNLNSEKSQVLPIFQHKMSYYSLNITPVLLCLNQISFLTHPEIGLWFNLIKPQVIGFPQPMLQLLEKINLIK